MDIQQSPSVKPQGNKYDTIQVFRFIAALMVIILHSTFYTSERLHTDITLYFRGANGVRLFFAISGFVMIVSSEGLKNKIGGWKIFAVKRITRIVPIYWLITTYKVFVIIFASSLVFHGTVDPIYILKSYFFIPARSASGEISPLLGVGWTLNFEMFFYLMFTIALAARINTISFLSCIFIPLSLISIYKTEAWPAIGFYANPIVLDFLYGMIAAKLLLMNKKMSQPVAAAAIIVGLLYLFVPQIKGLEWLYAADNIVTGLAAFLVVYGGASVEGFWGAKMPAWLVYLGGASYSLYLVHPIVAPLTPTILNKLNLQWSLASVVISVLAALVAGTVFYHFGEKPITNFFTRLTKKWKMI